MRIWIHFRSPLIWHLKKPYYDCLSAINVDLDTGLSWGQARGDKFSLGGGIIVCQGEIFNFGDVVTVFQCQLAHGEFFWPIRSLVQFDIVDYDWTHFSLVYWTSYLRGIIFKWDKFIKLNLASPFPQMSFSSVEIEHEGETPGVIWMTDFEIGSATSFALQRPPLMKQFFNWKSTTLFKKPKALVHMSVYAG